MMIQMTNQLEQRLINLRKRLVEINCDAVLISQPENRYYLSGFDGTAGFLLITKKHSILATDFRYTEQAEKQAACFEVIRTEGKMEDWLPDLMRRLSVKNIGFESGHLNYSIYSQLCNIFSNLKPNINLIPLQEAVDSLRAAKEPGEVELITRAVTLADAAMKYTIYTIKPGLTELEAAWETEKYLRENGSQPLPFNIIIASGPNSALPHAKPTERKIKKGEPIIIDLGAKFQNYTSDISRTICLGEPDDTFKKVYSIVLRAQQTAIDGITDKINATQADSLARDVIEHSGYGKQFGHSLGHGLGLTIHEEPYLSQNYKESLADNMVFTIEPGIYISGWGGVRLEDTVTLENGKIKLLSQTEKYDFGSSEC
ncbi:MAG: aminopeptidase P family protein [Chloroflexota bacterium]